MQRHRPYFRNGVRLKYLSQSGHFPSGNPRWYYKPRGEKGLAMPDAPKDSEAFLKAYVEASGESPKPKLKPFTAGTIGAGVSEYLGSSNFHDMAESTKQLWRSHCNKIRRSYGDANLEALSPRHIKKDMSQFDGHPANSRLKVWRSLCKYWDQQGITETNVAKLVSRRDTKKTDGFTPWTRDDFDAFRRFWPIGTKERLAFELMYRTCAAMGDTCRLSRRMLSDDGWLTYTRQKSKSTAVSPFFDSGPDWFEATDDLQKCLDAEPMNLTFLTTQYGKTRSAKGASSWFSAAATKAGLDADKSAHGVRKGRAAMFKENGAPADKRMAILGHETESEANHYSKSADLRKIIEGTEKFQLSALVPTRNTKPPINKGKKHA